MSVLARVPLFRALPAEALDRLAERGRPRRFASGDVLMRQGEPSDVLHVVVAGRVRVERERAGEPPLALAELGAGDVVGEMGLLDRAPRSATVVALEPTETMEVHATALAVVLIEHPAVAAELLRILSSRLRDADELADELARGR